MHSLKTGGHAACAIVATTTCLTCSVPALGALAGDANQDNTVGVADLIEVVTHFNLTCPAMPETCPTDFDSSDRTDILDLLVVLTNWGAVLTESTDDGLDVDSGGRLVGPQPVLVDSIYYDKYSRVEERSRKGLQLNQGWRTRGHNVKHGIDVLPYCYGGGVDQNADNHYSNQDLERFEAWLDANIPYEYDGPVVLDMEGDWWPMMNTADEALMEEIMDFYIQGLEYAEAMRPNAKFGYWGLPKKRMTGSSYDGPDVNRLLNRSGAIFPETYEYAPGVDNSARIQQHIESCIEMVQGQVPVYVQMCSRYQDQELGGWRHFLTNEELIRDQARPSLDARWTDANGDTHRIAGLGIWDAYIYVRWFHHDWWSLNDAQITALWDEVDAVHFSMYQALNQLLDEELGDSEPALAEAGPEAGAKVAPTRTSSAPRPGTGLSRSKATRGRVVSKSSYGRSPKRLATAARR